MSLGSLGSVMTSRELVIAHVDCKVLVLLISPGNGTGNEYWYSIDTAHLGSPDQPCSPIVDIIAPVVSFFSCSSSPLTPSAPYDRIDSSCLIQALILPSCRYRVLALSTFLRDACPSSFAHQSIDYHFCRRRSSRQFPPDYGRCSCDHRQWYVATATLHRITARALPTWRIANHPRQ